MKKIIILSILLSANSCLHAQSIELTNEIKYNQTITEHFNDNRFDSILHLHLNSKRTTIFSPYNVDDYIAKAYFERGEVDSGLFYLKKSVINLNYSDTSNLIKHFEKFNLFNSKEFKELIVCFDSLTNKCTDNFIQMRKDYYEIYNNDQFFRKHLNLFNKSNNIIPIEQAVRLLRMNDSLNSQKVLELIKRNNGFPTSYDIGNNSLYFVIYHISPFLDMDYITEEIRKVTLQGKLHNSYGPSLIDYIRKGDKLNSLYGTRTFINSKGVAEYCEIEDIENLDKRRADFLLPPLYIQAKIDNVLLPSNYKYKIDK